MHLIETISINFIEQLDILLMLDFTASVMFSYSGSFFSNSF